MVLNMTRAGPSPIFLGRAWGQGYLFSFSSSSLPLSFSPSCAFPSSLFSSIPPFLLFLLPQHSAHCASFSTASKMFSCGFPDSSIHLWSQLPGATTPPTSHHVTSTHHHYHTPSNQPIGLQNSSCSDHCVLLGHYGPVYSTCFDSVGQYMLSASEDTTVRLWHTQRRSSAVCYRGHAYPVWDVAFRLG